MIPVVEELEKEELQALRAALASTQAEVIVLRAELEDLRNRLAMQYGRETC